MSEDPSNRRYTYRRVSGDARSAIAVWTIELATAASFESLPFDAPPGDRVALRKFGTAGQPLDCEEVVVAAVPSGGGDLGEVATRFELTTHGGEGVAVRTRRLFDRTGGWATERSSGSLPLSPLVSAKTRTVAAWCLKAAAEFDRLCDEASEYPADCDWTEAAIDEAIRFGRQLACPPTIVLFGRPNVGKSSLLNTLVGYERAIVFDREGVTRDALQTPIVCGGWPAMLIDTAGTDDDRLPTPSSPNDRTLLVVDGSRPLAERERQWLAEGQFDLIVRTKGDLEADSESARADAAIANANRPCVDVSVTDAGAMASLVAALSDLLAANEPRAGVPVPLNGEASQRLQAVWAAVAAARSPAPS